MVELKSQQWAIPAAVAVTGCVIFAILQLRSPALADIPEPVIEATAAATADPTATRTTATASTTAQPSKECDANDLWFEKLSHEGRKPEQVMVEFISRVKAWTPDCRAKAMSSECKDQCDGFISGMLIKAAASKNEELELRKLRHGPNDTIVGNTTRFIAVLEQMARDAEGSMSQPRPHIHMPAEATEADMDANNAVEATCVARMKKDFEKIKKTETEAVTYASSLVVGIVPNTRSFLGYMESCVDCSRNRITCKEMKEELKTMKEILAERAKLVADDARFLKLRK